MNDITQYSDDELSLIVFNDEHFYNCRLNLNILFEELKGYGYKYTETQKEVLLQDIRDDAAED